jgi:hypothetical protein
MALKVEEGVVARLKADTAVSAIVGTRIRPLEAPQGDSYPLIVFRKVSDVPDYAMGGQSGLSEARIQIHCWAQDAPGGGSAGAYGQAKALAEAVRLRLSGWRGTVTVGADSIVIDHIGLENQEDLFDPETGSGIAIKGVGCDYVVAYRQQVPSWP